MLKRCLHLVISAVLSLVVLSVFSNGWALSEGYILTSAYGGAKTVLIDSTGQVVHEWDHTTLSENERLGGYSCYLTPEGNLLRSAIVPENQVIPEMAPRQGILQELDPEGNIVWRYELAEDLYMLHHDMKIMPNGHVLAVSFVARTLPQMKETGVDTNLVNGMIGARKFILSEKIIEIDPKADGGPQIVWEWHVYNHIIPGEEAAEHPELFSGKISNALFYTYQWMHLNGLDYNPDQDLILFSSRVFSELYIIDHSTTTEEAAGHTGGKRGKGGDILYRWGKPANYQVYNWSGKTLDCLHSVNWIPKGYVGEGDIVFFHNNSMQQKSEVIEIKPPMDENGNFSMTEGQAFGPLQPEWIYAPDQNFFSAQMSSAFCLPNGNKIGQLAYPSNGGFDISGNSRVVEIDRETKEVVWEYEFDIKGEAVTSDNPQKYNPAKIMYYDNDYPGILHLLGLTGTKNPERGASVAVSEKRASVTSRFDNVLFSNCSGCEISIHTLQGREIRSLRPQTNQFTFDKSTLPAGSYIFKIHGMQPVSKMVTAY